ncbi:MAG: DUF6781 family protein [Betaproteobacteria bacterium]
MSEENLQSETAASVAAGGDIRSNVREITLAALRARKFEFARMREVMTQVADGITAGADKHGSDMKQALSQAFAGLDDAFTKSAHATQLALAELATRTRELNDAELRTALAELKKMETDFVATLQAATERTGGKVKAEMQSLASHALRTGTDTGSVVAKTLGEFSGRVTATAVDSTATGLDAARKISARLAQVASGFLAGMSDVLAGKDAPKK